MVWRTGGTQAVVMLTTFVLTIVIPLQYAVLIGVAMSVILFVGHQSNKVSVVRWVVPPGSVLPREEPAPAGLPPGEVVVLGWAEGPARASRPTNRLGLRPQLEAGRGRPGVRPVEIRAVETVLVRADPVSEEGRMIRPGVRARGAAEVSPPIWPVRIGARP